MAKVHLNQFLEAIRGGVQGFIFRQRPDGKTILSGTPVRHRPSTRKQKAHQERFKQASHYARWAARHYPVYAQLAAGDPRWRSPYNFALSDWFEAPVIHRVERAGSAVRVQASDNIGVSAVRVSVLDEQGAVLERGDAVRVEGDWWEFTSQVQGASVLAEAWDLAENVVKMQAPTQPPPSPQSIL